MQHVHVGWDNAEDVTQTKLVIDREAMSLL